MALVKSKTKYETLYKECSKQGLLLVKFVENYDKAEKRYKSTLETFMQVKNTLLSARENFQEAKLTRLRKHKVKISFDELNHEKNEKTEKIHEEIVLLFSNMDKDLRQFMALIQNLTQVLQDMDTEFDPKSIYEKIKNSVTVRDLLYAKIRCILEDKDNLLKKTELIQKNNEILAKFKVILNNDNGNLNVKLKNEKIGLIEENCKFVFDKFQELEMRLNNY